MSEVSTNKKLKGKDLITIGIFSAIYFVINFAFMLLGGIHPVLWMLMPGFIAVFAGISLYADGRKGSKTGCSFPDGAYHGSYLFCHRTIYPGDPDLDGFYLHFG